MSESIWIIVIAGLGALAIFVPFFSNPKKIKDTVDGDELQHRKEQIFSQMADLEYDLYMYKISKEDYDQTKAELTAKASRILETTTTNLKEVEKEVDQEIERLLKGRKGVGNRA